MPNASFDIKSLLKAVNDATEAVKVELEEIDKKGEAISVTDMFKMQIKMNALAQTAEGLSALVSAAHAAISAAARNVKG